jgi:flagellar biosynthetic protein FliR
VITFTEEQALAWITPLLWPFLRALALFSSLPLLGTRTVPMRVRVALAALIAVAAQASLPPMPQVALDSSAALLLVVQQLLIGISLGFAVRLVFAAIELAGEIVGLQMGLNFAGFFDPLT